MGKSHQRGWVVLRGKKWYGYCRRTVLDPTNNEERVETLTVILGQKSQMTKFQARERLELEIAKQSGQNPGGRVMNDGAVTFGWFVRHRFLPLKEANWKPETAKVKKLLIQKDLIDSFDHMPLESFDRFILQVDLNKLAKTRSKDRVLQMRAYVRDIFAEAVEQDFLVKDPARKVTVPSQLRDTDKTTLTWEQLRNALSHLSLRDRILLELDMTNALRPSELFALRWKCFDQADRKCTYSKPPTKALFGIGAKPRRVWDACTCRRNWRTICGSGSRSVRTRRLKPSFFQMPKADSWTPATTAGGCCTNWRRTSNCRS
jgi:hypothetical protein